MKYLLVVLLLPLTVFAQVDITNNLVNTTTIPTTTTSTWQNVVFDSSLQCWAPGGPGNCGPKPTYNTSTNTINFSYGLSDVYQKANVSKALPYGGTGLVTTGFTFGWESKNGNGWDDGRLDQLSAYVKLYSSNDAKVLETFNWNLTYLHNWTTFTVDKTWSNIKLGYRENQLGNVQYGFIGMDNNYWAGTYGPEVTNITFQLKYKPDPCKNNPLFSPECPNFTQELQKANQTPLESSKTNLQETKEESTVHSTENKTSDNWETDYETYTYSSDKLEMALTKIFDVQVNQEQRTLEVAQDAVLAAERTADRVVKQAESIARDSQQRSIRESLELKPEMLGQTQQTKKDVIENSFALIQGPNTTSGGMKLNAQNVQLNQFDLTAQKDIGQPEQSSTRAGTLQQTQQTQLQTVLNLYTRSSQEQIATTASTNVQQTQAITLYNSSNTSNQLELIQQKPSAEIATVSTVAILQVKSSIPEAPNTSTTNFSTSTINQLNIQPAVVSQDIPQQTSNFLTNKADPLNSIVDSKPELLQETILETKTALVNKNVKDSDVAGAISIDRVARVPQGFNTYLIALQDAAFYPSKEIYRNQRVIDNQRLLRQLSSDRLHQEMINLQYRSRQ